MAAGRTAAFGALVVLVAALIAAAVFVGRTVTFVAVAVGAAVEVAVGSCVGVWDGRIVGVEVVTAVFVEAAVAVGGSGVAEGAGED